MLMLSAFLVLTHRGMLYVGGGGVERWEREKKKGRDRIVAICKVQILCNLILTLIRWG
jgi:hypothetical protein